MYIMYAGRSVFGDCQHKIRTKQLPAKQHMAEAHQVHARARQGAWGVEETVNLARGRPYMEAAKQRLKI